jgi:hypothetical protein
MAADEVRTPSPARQAAGRANRVKRGPLTEEGRERLRQAAQQYQPWRFATGPRTPSGKSISASNGAKHRGGERGVRELRRETAEVLSLAAEMAALRASLLDI